MPTYEFRCANGHEFEQFHKISDAPSTAACPTCGVESTRAISGGAGLLFKGSGFYLTDYGKNAHRGGAAPTPGGGESKGEGGGKGEGSAKPDGGSAGGSGSGAPASAPAPSGTPAPSAPAPKKAAE
jgi:putative FmdB family regulatory protein